ncbi:MAG: ABC transporter permease [Chloroflexota bacterium]|nr:ABC transporter permease [Chloroflexota bacterium]
MTRYVARRLLQAIPTVFGILVLTFALTRLSPADPIAIMFANHPEVSQEARAVVRQAYGLDDPIPIQFVKWAGRVATLDLGTSFVYHRPVLDLILERLPNSLQLSLAGLVVAVVIGVPLGLVAALYRGRLPDHAIRILSVVLNSVPEFFLGLVLILVLAIQLHWIPAGSMNVVGEYCTFCWDRLWHLLAPVTLAAAGGIAALPRFVRTEVLEVLGQDYVRTARGKGLRERSIMLRHVLRNALIPVVTIFGGILAILVSGSVIIEVVFNWPGLGRLIFDAANSKDYPIVQAGVLMASVLLVLSYILRDLAYAWVDPRIAFDR